VEIFDSVVIGAGQAGLSSSFHLRRRGIAHVVLDANSAAGGAWQHRWRSLTMHDVHGVAALPDLEVPLGSER
jgi:cation diffusion facilitator CzcD-associated flavoprotein CzcO